MKFMEPGSPVYHRYMMQIQTNLAAAERIEFEQDLQAVLGEMQDYESVQTLAAGTFSIGFGHRERAILFVTNSRIIISVHEARSDPTVVLLNYSDVSDIGIEVTGLFFKKYALTMCSQQGNRSRFIIGPNSRIARELYTNSSQYHSAH